MMPEEMFGDVSAGKQRHGCLTAYLIFMIFINTLMSLAYFLTGGAIAEAADVPGWSIPVLGLFGLINVACAVGLFMWKKWCFLGFAASACIVFALNLIIGLGVGSSVFGLVGIAVLYGVLQIGDGNKGWDQLE